MRYYDAHCHLQDTRLDPCRDVVFAALDASSIAVCIVNGTDADDWPAVAKLSQSSRIRPAFGLHPWKVKHRQEDWFSTLESHLLACPGALIGEIGLDRWIEDPHFDAQIDAFEQQLELAAALDIPPTVHCLKAWGHLLSLLQNHASKLPGFLLHSYAGPAEMVDAFVELGAHFSFSGYFLNPERTKKLEAWRRIPLERVLIETDAPDMLPPPQWHRPLNSSDACKELNHPGNLPAIYEGAATFFELPSDVLAEQVETTFRRLFGTPNPEKCHGGE